MCTWYSTITKTSASKLALYWPEPGSMPADTMPLLPQKVVLSYGEQGPVEWNEQGPDVNGCEQRETCQTPVSCHRKRFDTSLNSPWETKWLPWSVNDPWGSRCNHDSSGYAGCQWGEESIKVISDDIDVFILLMFAFLAHNSHAQSQWKARAWGEHLSTLVPHQGITARLYHSYLRPILSLDSTQLPSVSAMEKPQ